MIRLITGENILKGDTVWIRWADGTVISGTYSYGDIYFDGEQVHEAWTIQTHQGRYTVTADFLYLTKGEAKYSPRRWYEIHS